MTATPIPHRVLAGATRSRLLEILRAAERPLGIGELADPVGLHPNSVREQLALLMEAGLVERSVGAPAGRGRPGMRYRATPDADDVEPYRALAHALAAQVGRMPDPPAASLAAGERWGRSLVADTDAAPTVEAAMDRLIALLDATGYAPEPPDGPSDPIRLRRCPFEPLAHEQGAVVCGVHLGLMRGALRELQAPLEAVGLQPFVEPGLCLAYLGVPDHA